MSGVDPVQQVEVWLQDYMEVSHRRAFEKPAHSICLNVCRAMFSTGAALPDLEAILQRLLSERVKPTAYRWLAKEIREAFEDLKHERATKIEVATK